MQKKIKNDEQYFDNHVHKYSSRRLRKLCQKVKNMSVGKTIEDLGISSMGYLSEEY